MFANCLDIGDLPKGLLIWFKLVICVVAIKTFILVTTIVYRSLIFVVVYRQGCIPWWSLGARKFECSLRSALGG